jgi:hypothetical protein
MDIKRLALIFLCGISSTISLAQENPSSATEKVAKDTANRSAATDLAQFGFGPALFLIAYDDEILEDSKDVTLRGDGSISASGTDYSVTLGA